MLTKSVLLPHAAADMFDLVARVEDYPNFLPWCPGTEVQRTENGMVATIGIRYKGIRQSFTTRNVHERPTMIRMDLVDGPFRHLHGHWRFVVHTPCACTVEFMLDYEIAGGLVGRALKPVFGRLAGTFVDAFVRQAALVHPQGGA